MKRKQTVSGKSESRRRFSEIWRSLQFVQGLVPWLIPLIVFMGVVTAAEPFIGIFFGSMILDQLVDGRTVADIMQLVVIMAVTSSIAVILHWGLSMFVNIGKVTVDDKLDLAVYEKSMTLDYEILEKKETLELENKGREAMNTGNSITSLCDCMGSLVQNGAEILYAVVLLVPLFTPLAGTFTGLTAFMNSPASALLLAALIVSALLIRFYSNKGVNRLQQKSFDGTIEYNRKFSVFFGLLDQYAVGKDIRMYRMQDMILHAMDDSNDHTEKRVRHYINKQIPVKCIGESGNLLLQVSSYVYVGLKAIAGLVTIGSVVRYASAIQRLTSAVDGVLGTYIKMEMCCRYLVYFKDFMEIENQKYEGTLPVEKRNDNEYEIEFRDVSFHYPNSEEMVLRHVSTKFHIGQKMAVVGKNGAGKSTFIKLLCRLYDPTEGEILLNGIDIKLYDYDEYMSVFSIVFQDFKLFSFSIAENVAASVEFEGDKVESCLVQAGFGDRLEEIENGIHANIYQDNEEGIEISGGEAQKIAIARALYKDSPFVILDEPTSALDPVSEYEIYKRFNNLVQDKTSVYISHRMSSCRFCDRILVFEKGRIVQDGSHDSLMEEKNGVYHELWNAQAQYYQ